MNNLPAFSGVVKSGAFWLLASLFIFSSKFEKQENLPDKPIPLELTTYSKRPIYLPSRHLETVVPSVFFRPPTPKYDRERMELSDGDFLDMDWIISDNDRLIIISHGMEGDSYRHYVTRAANYFSERNWDILAWNQRGCSGELNRLPKLAHHGSAQDLSEVVEAALAREYSTIILLGFSMGGCQTLKYLSTESVDDRVKGGVGFSVTFDFGDMMDQFGLKSNALYKNVFLNKLRKKIALYAELHPQVIDVSDLNEINDFETFHLNYSTRLNGDDSLEQFYHDASPGNFVSSLQKPMLVVNAQNDPFLGERNYPEGMHPLLTTYYPQVGGHLGFTLPLSTASYMELVADEFISDHL